MLYKFKSKNTGDIIMLQPHAEQVLELLGRETANGAANKGIIQAAQIPAALIALQEGIAAEEAQKEAAAAEALAKNEPTPVYSDISLRKRTLPFIDMLKRCESDGDDVVWGV